MFRKIMQTGNSPAVFVLRITLGMVLLAHGLQQTLGLFGGKGLMGKMEYYHHAFHIPFFIGFIGIMTVSIGSVLLIVGLWSRIIAFLDIIFLVVAVCSSHIHNGFFMNWEGMKSGEGFEYHILAVGIALAIVIYGSGWFSLDKYFTHRKRS